MRTRRFFAERAWVVDVSGCEDGYLIEVEDLKEVQNSFRKGDSLLIRSDWYKKLGSDTYRNGLPRISEALARWCVEYQVKILGVEPPSVADVNDLEEVTTIHRILLGNVIIVEGLCHLDQITKPHVQLIALPSKFKREMGHPAE
ncbi:MAG: cyclase family protein [Spirosomataceae bacterium]